MGAGAVTGRWRRSAAALALAALLGAAGCGGSDAGPGAPAAPPDDPANPLDGEVLFVDPASSAAQQVQRWTAEGRTADAEALRRIADQPVPLWVTGDPAAVEGEVRARVAEATAAGRTALLVGYNIPDRDCNNYSGGGAPDAATYRAWYTAFAAGLGDARTVVVLEPDAVPHGVEGCAGIDPAQRYALLGEAVDALTARPGTRVYLDAGNSAWIGDTGALADALARSGVARADGFALNVSNFRPTEEALAYGRDVAARVGGARFVVDTSRNGRGPHPEPVVGGHPSWCNPPDRALGAAPTTTPGSDGVDAFLWVKEPGDSDGSCRPGEPPAGAWWPDYALELVRAAS